MTFNYYGSEKNFLPEELSKAKKFVDGELKKLFQGKSLTGIHFHHFNLEFKNKCLKI